MRALTLTICALTLSGCFLEPFDPNGHACSTQADCLAGYRCEMSVCVAGEPTDAGVDASADAITTDAPAIDAVVIDAFVMDAPATDAPVIDAFVVQDSHLPDGCACPDTFVEPDAFVENDASTGDAAVEDAPVDAPSLDAATEDAPSDDAR